jgi:hypothetical protein
MEKTDKFIFAIVVFAIIVSIFSLFFIFNLTGVVTGQDKQNQQSMPKSMSRMKLTSFDTTLARKLMDADGDGKCDVCGMDVELCMSSGQLQCNMDSMSTIGILGSSHIHADWKIYINGKSLDNTFFAPLAMDMSGKSTITSSFIHVDKSSGDNGDPSLEKTGDVIHMHATGVPLWIFFDSIKMEFNKNCISLPTGKKFCNEGKKMLRFYVNGKPNDQWEKYVFKDGDKILISYGDETDLSSQLKSITNFAMNH